MLLLVESIIDKPSPVRRALVPGKPTRTEIVGWRTRLLPGAEELYSRVHSRLADPIASALRSAGVVQWRIWRDGQTLFHMIETTRGRDEMGRKMAALGPIDPDWDALIATLIDPSEDASALLPLVWGMDGTTQMSDPLPHT
ncbi:L-rhamnose mutarotase [Leifsonia poae]|uniref:L-rhamnose mutarotase n=1 Tax=Leifsonia poae TaxID=110933 RepID=UPI003D674770